jgi:hypothetical protein
VGETSEWLYLLNCVKKRKQKAICAQSFPVDLLKCKEWFQALLESKTTFLFMLPASVVMGKN